MGYKLNLLASTALTTSTAVLTATASAADLRMPVKAPLPVSAAPFSWTGCYIGGNAGGVIARFREEILLTGVSLESRESATGFIGGAQIGCNWQSSPNWVLGLESDINYAHAGRSRAFVFTTSEDVTGTQATKLQWLGTLRGRVGPTWDRSFLYATGGLAIGGVKSSVSATAENGAPFSGSTSDTRSGWTAGVGFEYAFSRSISGKLEYLHFDLGRLNHLVALTSGGSGVPHTWTANARLNGDVIRAGVNIRLTP